MTHSVEQVLQGAGDLLADPKHWYQGYYSNKEGTAFCLMGAVIESLRLYGVKVDPFDAPVRMDEALAPLQAVIGQQYPEFTKSHLGREQVYLAHWNDDPARQHAEVVEMVDKARAYAAEKGI